MANEDKKFDDLFKSKLSNYEIKPSSLAWEKLEGKLNKKGKAAYFPFLKIAASIVLLLGVGYIAWFISKKDIKREQPQLAEAVKQVGEPTIIQEELLIAVNNKNPDSLKIQEEQVIPQQVEKKNKQEVVLRNADEVRKQELIAEIKAIQKVETVIALPELVIPELDINQALVTNQLIPIELEEEISYKITIIGKGLEASETNKGGLINQIENRVEKIGGLLNQVDQGFADLQDAKDNLFASITSRKERSK